MGGYKNIERPDISGYENIGVLWVRPVDFCAAFKTFERISTTSGKTTRLYFFVDVVNELVGAQHFPRCWVLISDYKSTSEYDDGMPSYAQFWDSSSYEMLEVSIVYHSGERPRQQSFELEGICEWVYSSINLST